MYGVEYDLNVFGYDNGDDILCVVCCSWFVISFIMIFGMNNCVFGWKIQYKGYFVVGVYNE